MRTLARQRISLSLKGAFAKNRNGFFGRDFASLGPLMNGLILGSWNIALREVSVSEIRGLPCLPQIDFDARMETARTTDAVRWAAAESRETIIRAYLDGDGTIGTRLRAAAEALGVSPRTIRRLVARYRISAQTTSLVPRSPGPHQIRRRLGVLRKRIIAEAIETRFLIRPRTPMQEVYRLVEHRCQEASIPAPARGSVLSCIRALDARHVARRR